MADLGFEDDRRWSSGALFGWARRRSSRRYTAIEYAGQRIFDRRIRFDDTVFDRERAWPARSKEALGRRSGVRLSPGRRASSA
jgi:hypothetical protein